MGFILFLGVMAFFAAFSDRGANLIYAMVKANSWPIIQVDMVHAATVTANTAFVIFLQPGKHGAVLTFWRMKIYSAAGGVVAAFARTGDARAWAMSRDHPNLAEFFTDLVEPRFNTGW